MLPVGLGLCRDRTAVHDTVAVDEDVLELHPYLHLLPERCPEHPSGARPSQGFGVELHVVAHGHDILTHENLLSHHLLLRNFPRDAVFLNDATRTSITESLAEFVGEHKGDFVDIAVEADFVGAHIFRYDPQDQRLSNTDVATERSPFDKVLQNVNPGIRVVRDSDIIFLFQLLISRLQLRHFRLGLISVIDG